MKDGSVLSSQPCDRDALSAYVPFIREGTVSLLGSDVKVPIKILWDTGAYDSYIVDSVLPFSIETDAGDRVLSRGIGLTVIPVPLHRLVLDCDLVKGDVVVGVRPALPVEGVHFILGNGLAGSCVWTDSPPSPVVTPCPVVSEDSGAPLEVSSACVATRAMAKINSESSAHGSVLDVSLGVPSLSELPLSLSQSEVVRVKRNDPSLKGLFERVLPATEIASAANGCLLFNELLFRKWVPVGEHTVKGDIFQLVVPDKMRPLVLKVAHDECGHFGVRKTYLGILKHFFWPRVKRDVSAYIKTCHACQLTGKPIQAEDEPFSHLIVDCVKISLSFKLSSIKIT